MRPRVLKTCWRRLCKARSGFPGVEAGQLDVTFVSADDGRAAELARVGLRFDLPQPAKPVEMKAPGLDPNAPPRLK